VSLDEAAKVKLKKTEIGQMFVDWEIADLIEIAELTMGQSPPGNTYNNLGKGIPLINGPTEYGLRHPKIIQWTTSPTKLCQNNDILFCVRGNTLGKLNIANGSYCIGRGVAAIRGIKNISETKFIYYFLEYRAKSIYASCAGQNSTFPNISGASMKKLKIIKPPISTQKQIAQILCSIDEQIFAKLNEKDCLEKLFNSMLSNLMSAKIRVNNLEF
jgi:type I restriction enzyme, S subunit